MLEGEAAGLEALQQAAAVRVPQVLAVGAAGDQAYLALEWIDLRPGGARAVAELGERLARQHHARAQAFGWARENFIGATPQPNTWTADWVDFLRRHRLQYQLHLAGRNGHDGRVQRLGEKLLERLPAFFTGYQPVPALLHGDLWGGNWGEDGAGRPVIFDPAVYFGDREADIAMTRLFGGFGPQFYAAYQAAWPLDAGARVRATLYNLYHLLNHLNLFGDGYLGQVEAAMGELLAQTR